jgi:hypothetical protein
MKSAALMALLALGCSSKSESNQAATAGSEAAAQPTQVPTMTDTDKAEPACIASLVALATGALADFTGLAGCTRAHADAAFGGGAERAQGSDDAEVRYPGNDVIPSGVRVLFDGDSVTAVDIREPLFEGDPRTMLGEPEAVLRSQLSAGTKQLVYADRGLAVHYREVDSSFKGVVAFPPTTVEAFESSDLAGITGPRREPLRRR